MPKNYLVLLPLACLVFASCNSESSASVEGEAGDTAPATSSPVLTLKEVQVASEVRSGERTSSFSTVDSQLMVTFTIDGQLSLDEFDRGVATFTAAMKSILAAGLLQTAGAPAPGKPAQWQVAIGNFQKSCVQYGPYDGTTRFRMGWNAALNIVTGNLLPVFHRYLPSGNWVIARDECAYGSNQFFELRDFLAAGDRADSVENKIHASGFQGSAPVRGLKLPARLAGAGASEFEKVQLWGYQYPIQVSGKTVMMLPKDMATSNEQPYTGLDLAASLGLMEKLKVKFDRLSAAGVPYEHAQVWFRSGLCTDVDAIDGICFGSDETDAVRESRVIKGTHLDWTAQVEGKGLKIQLLGHLHGFLSLDEYLDGIARFGEVMKALPQIGLPVSAVFPNAEMSALFLDFSTEAAPHYLIQTNFKDGILTLPKGWTPTEMLQAIQALWFKTPPRTSGDYPITVQAGYRVERNDSKYEVDYHSAATEADLVRQSGLVFGILNRFKARGLVLIPASIQIEILGDGNGDGPMPNAIHFGVNTSADEIERKLLSYFKLVQ